KKQGLGLIKFIGKFFKLQMLVKWQLGTIKNSEEVEIKSLCQLLKTVGQLLGTQNACAHMDVYFTRMKE
ncbi:hypothetical protein EDD22DRAFT_757868, partial [Suillus occidentalis]